MLTRLNPVCEEVETPVGTRYQVKPGYHRWGNLFVYDREGVSLREAARRKEPVEGRGLKHYQRKNMKYLELYS